MTGGDMTAEQEETVKRILAGLHRLLLRLAGRVPDEFLFHARSMLAEGDLAYLPDTLSGAAAGLAVSLTPADAGVLRDVLVAFGAGEEPAAMERVPSCAIVPETGHRFAPAAPDLTGGPADVSAGPADLMDALVVDALTEHDGVIAVWRAWRFGSGGRPQDGRRVYLAEVEPGVPAWELTMDAQRELVLMEVDSPQVEVYWAGDDLPPYHRTARAAATPLWTRP
ncbi:hypothetical protein [Nonomuraea sp. NPDC002799]